MRKHFLQRFVSDRVPENQPPKELTRHLWGIEFRAPLFNAAGMFKNAEGYRTVAAQGAGAYLAGTSTNLARTGNTKNGITHPFVPYPRSGSASNWLGLPNRGHAAVAGIVSRIEKVRGCPIGASLSIPGDASSHEELDELIEGMKMYERAGTDFIELNESCPNVPGSGHAIAVSDLDAALVSRLEYVAEKFIRHSQKKIPIIVKLSNDTQPVLVAALVEVLTSLGYGGINIGNTSTNYTRHRVDIATREQRVFDYFSKNFGGGLSGRILKNDSLALSQAAVNAIPTTLSTEFHVIRTGGIESSADVIESLSSGIALCQWYTGYFESFARIGHGVYQEMFEQLHLSTSVRATI